MKKVNLDLDDLTNAALKRLVKQLLTADDSEELAILDELLKDSDKEASDLVELKEEKRGSPRKIAVEDDMPKGKS